MRPACFSPSNKNVNRRQETSHVRREHREELAHGRSRRPIGAITCDLACPKIGPREILLRRRTDNESDTHTPVSHVLLLSFPPKERYREITPFDSARSFLSARARIPRFVINAQAVRETGSRHIDHSVRGIIHLRLCGSYIRALLSLSLGIVRTCCHTLVQRALATIDGRSRRRRWQRRSCGLAASRIAHVPSTRSERVKLRRDPKT